MVNELYLFYNMILVYFFQEERKEGDVIWTIQFVKWIK